MAERTQEERELEQFRQFRRIVADVVAELRGQEIRDAFASISIEELMDRHIDEIEGTDRIKPSKLQRIRKVYTDFVQNIEGMKATDPSSFRAPDPDADVNTAQDPNSGRSGEESS